MPNPNFQRLPGRLPDELPGCFLAGGVGDFAAAKYFVFVNVFSVSKRK
jgi:hypothetical protein